MPSTSKSSPSTETKPTLLTLRVTYHKKSSISIEAARRKDFAVIDE
ncbi:MAG: hypothetical protein ONB43_27235 [candidate division KSB1 bacterium]|nr:hypothetical protein [candidate division KSB1 bacterium]